MLDVEEAVYGGLPDWEKWYFFAGPLLVAMYEEDFRE
jgi:hypothetical protein